MSESKQFTEFDSQFQPRARVNRRPRLAIRQRANEQPMAMFSVLVFVALASMALAPTRGPDFASMGTAPRAIDGARTTQKTDRLQLSEADIACQGQAWGVENETCLLAIARESGMQEVQKVRHIASAVPVHTTPNIFSD